MYQIAKPTMVIFVYGLMVIRMPVVVLCVCSAAGPPRQSRVPAAG